MVLLWVAFTLNYPFWRKLLGMCVGRLTVGCCYAALFIPSFVGFPCAIARRA